MADSGTVPADLQPLTVFSYLALAAFLCALVFCFFPVRIPVPPWQRQSPWFRIPLGVATAPVLAVLFLLATTAIPFAVVRTGIVGFGDVEPWAIVILIFSLSYMSVSIELSGLFGFLALKVATLGGKSGRKFFVYIYLLTAVVAAIFSNDVVVLVLTPIILYFTTLIDADAFPYLVSTFQVANTASMFLVIGNPTNIVVAQANQISYAVYTAWMALPALAATGATLALLLLVFRNRIPAAIPDVLGSLANDTKYQVHDPIDMWFGLACMVSCLLTLLLVSFFKHVSVALLTAPWALLVLSKDLVRDLLDTRRSSPVGDGDVEVELGKTDGEPVAGKLDSEPAAGTISGEMKRRSSVPSLLEAASINSRQSRRVSPEVVAPEPIPVADSSSPDTKEIAVIEEATDSQPRSRWLTAVETVRARLPRTSLALARLPWAVAPFCLSLFILVGALNYLGWTGRLAWAFSFLCPNFVAAVFSIGFLSALSSNIFNNLPMTILFVLVIEHPLFLQFADSASEPLIKQGAYWGLCIGSNLGANLTPIGALAGLIWLSVLGRFSFRVSWAAFFKHGVATMPAVLAIAAGIVAGEMAVVK
ncbi:arsenical pump membrane protein-domain-containing protein [Hyaloraphidium curvatum]|nr:arsenical pump membrane protein-domain-containing protein [Hyaloraphidium curvatum]